MLPLGTKRIRRTTEPKVVDLRNGLSRFPGLGWAPGPGFSPVSTGGMLLASSSLPQALRTHNAVRLGRKAAAEEPHSPGHHETRLDNSRRAMMELAAGLTPWPTVSRTGSAGHPRLVLLDLCYATTTALAVWSRCMVWSLSPPLNRSSQWSCIKG
jgi:hypothetical protein